MTKDRCHVRNAPSSSKKAPDAIKCTVHAAPPFSATYAERTPVYHAKPDEYSLLDALSYAHFNSETSKTGCRGRLFEGVDEEGYQPVQEEGNGGPGERRQNYQVEGVEMGWQEYEAQFWEEEEG